jgi:predicted porin
MNAHQNTAHSGGTASTIPTQPVNPQENTMNPTQRCTRVLLLAALSMAAPTAALAQSNVSIYGLMDMSAGQFQTAGATKLWRADSGNMTTSFIGFKGTEDLGGGLNGVFRIEHFLRADQGAAGRFNGDAFWARNAYVGLQGAFGATLLGRNTTPLFVSTLIFNAIGDSFGFSPSIRQLFTPSTGLAFFGDTGWNNSILYNSPSLGGVTINLAANLGEGAAGATGKNIGGNVLYFGGPIAATAAFQQVKNGAFGTPAGWKSQDTFQLGVSYDLNVAKVFGQYGRVKTKATADTQTTLYGIGASVPIGAGKVLAQYGNAKADFGSTDVSNKTLTLGYDHNLSKNTDVYAVLMNDKRTGLNTGNTFAAGVRLRY